MNMKNLLNIEWLQLAKHLGIFVGISILAILFFFYIYLPVTTNHGETITVPNLEGMAFEDLETFVGQRNLRFEVSDSSYSARYKPLTVLSQFPAAGSKVKENRKIYLTVNSFVPPSTRMPDLIDRSLRNAELELSSYELRRGKIILKPSPYENAVLEQRFEGNPIEPGTNIPKGTVIDLVVGDGYGTRRFLIPDFSSMPIDEALVSVAGMDLRKGTIYNAYGPSDALGFVYKQSPTTGSEVKVGQSVDFWIVPTDSLLQVKLQEQDSIANLTVEDEEL